MKVRALRTALVAACAAIAFPAFAQNFPAKPIVMICPWPAGGSTDQHLRAFAQIASKYVGRNIVVENKPGAGGMLGPGIMAKTAQPDGYTISQLPVGAFRIPHLLIEELQVKTGVQMLHVPFKGNADSTQALMGGHVMSQSDATGWGRHVDAGTFRLLVTFGEKRTKWNAPTAKELGIDIVSYSPYGFVAPKGLDPKIQKFMHDAFRKALDDPEHMKVLAQLDQVYWYKSSEDYARWAAETYKSERTTIEKVGLLIK